MAHRSLVVYWRRVLCAHLGVECSGKIGEALLEPGEDCGAGTRGDEDRHYLSLPGWKQNRLRRLRRD